MREEELLICGTAAAEGWPALFCTCQVCATARTEGGKNNRTRSAYMLGDTVRVDFGPDSYMHQLQYGLAYEKLEHLLVTHSHGDHWTPLELGYRRRGFSVRPSEPLHVWGNQAVRRKFVEVHGEKWDELGILFHLLVPWEEFQVSSELRVTPLVAAHDAAEECYNFLFRKNDRTLLIGNDTGWYSPQTWDFLSGVRLSTLIFDCTMGRTRACAGHHNCTAVVEATEELRKRGALLPDVRVIATHFSHNGGWLHEELVKFFDQYEIDPAFDGLRVRW